MARVALNGAVLWLDRIAPLAAEAEGGLIAWLSAPEQARLARLTSARRRASFLAGRVLLRRLLATVCGGDPARDWPLDAPEDLPPVVLGGGPALALSHSGDWVAAAISNTPAGLDIEAAGRTRDVMGLAAAVCTAEERQRLAALQDAAQQEAFRELWTVKEAWIKQRTEGASPDRLARISTALASDAEPAAAWSWRCADLALSWVHADGPPRWQQGESVFAGRPPRAWRVDDAPY
ncbi:MAG: 4'-phosphopantetheinyl transferase family protein [Rhizobacter sp.]